MLELSRKMCAILTRKDEMFPMFTFHFRLASNVPHRGDTIQFMTRGEVYVETENGYFPCIGWGDLILSSISMWIGNTIRMLDPNDGEVNASNYFMDGPYSIDLQKTGKDQIMVKFIRHIGEADKDELPPVNVALMDYCHALLELAENIISDPNFQWYGKEQERINFKQGVSKLKAYL